ncbi:MAG: SAM-dependent methyltransferase [Acidimicrobiales bacterium]
MPSYALLLKANTNRVYGEAAFALAAAELASFAGALGGGLDDVQREPIGGVDYLRAEAPEPLDPAQVAIVGNLSSLHALYEVDRDLLRPVPAPPLAATDDDITTIQRYSGKTNEAFTHLLVNVALAQTPDGFARLRAGERLGLLDPACGRGTSLNRAIVYGMDACGIELDQRDVEAYTTFVLTWMKDKRLKHHVEQAKLRKGRDMPAHRITVTYGPTKDRSSHRVVDIIHDDTVGARTHLKVRTMDLLVCDLPYGVQHGSQPRGGRLDRGPAELLHVALPVWFELLRPGSGAVLAWNRNTLPRSRLVDLVTASGFELRRPADDEAFLHRVDRAILRDVLVARRPV